MKMPSLAANPSAHSRRRGSPGFALILAMAAAAAPASKWEPPPGKTLLLIGQDRASIDGYIGALNHAPAGVMLYTNLADLGGLRGPVDYGAGSQDLPYWSARQPAAALQVGLYLVNLLGGIQSGSYDRNIDAMAALLRDTRRPVFLRIGYEFDSDWANYEPAAFQRAWRRIVERFRALGADNVAFVWHSWGFHYSHGRAGPEDWYPGDGYVDWCALSYFSPWNETTRAWVGRSRRNMIGFARSRGKPLMVAEASTKAAEQPSLGTASWEGWFAPMLEFVDTSGARALCYINADWDSQDLWRGRGWGDSRIQTNSLVLANWKREMAGPRWLLASDSLVAVLARGGSSLRRTGNGKLAGYVTPGWLREALPVLMAHPGRDLRGRRIPAGAAP